MLDLLDPAGRRDELQEQALVLVLGPTYELLHSRRHEGSNAHIMLPWREVVAVALEHGSRALVLHHSHPCCDASPSSTDIVTTRSICRMLRPLRIRLLDHVIWSQAGRFSFREAGLL
jgi:DNA repair protein RadC